MWILYCLICISGSSLYGDAFYTMPIYSLVCISCPKNHITQCPAWLDPHVSYRYLDYIITLTHPFLWSATMSKCFGKYLEENCLAENNPQFSSKYFENICLIPKLLKVSYIQTTLENVFRQEWVKILCHCSAYHNHIWTIV